MLSLKLSNAHVGILWGNRAPEDKVHQHINVSNVDLVVIIQVSKDRGGEVAILHS